MKPTKKERVERAKLVLPGTICGDIIGSAYEFNPTKDYWFEIKRGHSHLTDDTICTIAVADAIMSGKPFDEKLQEWCGKYPYDGYGGMFSRWIRTENPRPYNSYGNGSAMRVSAAGAIARNEKECLELAEKSAVVTHNHPEGVKGAQAVALAIYLALEGRSKDYIQGALEQKFGYDLSRNYEVIKRDYGFEEICQTSVPEAIIAFLGSDDYESTIRRAVALGGDADTQAAIAGGIAAAYYGEIPEEIFSFCMKKVPEEMMEVINRFDSVLEREDGR